MLTKRTVLATAMAAGLTSSLGRVASAQAKQVTVRIGFNPFAGTAGINGIIQERKLYEKYAAKYGYSVIADWKQFNGIHWIPNAPSDRMNEFQPLAEQQILFLFVATGKGTLYALPQYLAELAILVAVFLVTSSKMKSGAASVADEDVAAGLEA